MNKNLLILASGRLGAMTQEIAQEMNCFEEIRCLSVDDIINQLEPKLHNNVMQHLLSQIEALSVDYQYGITAIENSELRLWLNQELENCCYTVPIISHPFSAISYFASIGKGCIIEPGVIIEGECRIGDGVLLQAGSIIGSYSLIGEGSSLGFRSVISESVLISPETTIKAGTILAAGDSEMICSKKME